MDDLCASIQKSIIDILLKKILKATKELNINQVAIAGGVSANSGLRAALQQLGIEKKWETYIPKFEYCTDNAAMIAITGKYMFEKGLFADQYITASARFPMNDLAF